MRKIRDLSELDLPLVAPSRQLRVCVVTSEVLGPFLNGGIATSISGMIDQLAADNHSVTVLYTLVEGGTPYVAQRSWSHWVDAFSRRGIRLEFIPHAGDYRSWRRKSWLVMEFLGSNDFDLVYFNEHHGSGYYSLAAKRAGLAPFAEQLHCVITHGSIEWVFSTNDQYISRSTDLEVMGFERRSVEWADVVIGPSRYLLREYEKYGWELPEQTFHQPYPLHRSAIAHARDLTQVEEIVFFGRLETRKGLWLFCDALDQIRNQLPGRVVTFLGRMTDFSGVSTGALIIARAAQWPFRIKLITDYDQERALGYLREPGRLAVMPSLSDNSPCVIYECIENGIPFLTTKGSGADELVHPDIWQHVMVDVAVEDLARQLSHVLANGARQGRLRFDPAVNLATWSAWHHRIANSKDDLIVRGPRRDLGLRRDTDDTLIVMVDDGLCPLSSLVDALSNHAEKFSELAGLLVLSPREGLVQDFLYAAASARLSAKDSAIVFLGPNEIDEAREVVTSAKSVFLIDMPFELQMSFFLTASGLLSGDHAAAISCASGVRGLDQNEFELAELPHGDIPAVSALGFTLGSRAWALLGSRMQDDSRFLELYDQEKDEFLSPASIGHSIAHRLIQRGEKYVFLPVVGAVASRQGKKPKVRTRSYHEVVMGARDLDVEPSLHSGGAPWFAISKFGVSSTRREWDDLAGVEALCPEHPLLEPHSKPLAQFAAALGRLNQSISLGIMSRSDISELSEIAKRAVHFRRRYRLDPLMLSAEPYGDVSRAQGTTSDERLIIRERVAALIRSKQPDDMPLGSAETAISEIDDEESLVPEEIREATRVYYDATAVTIKNGIITVRNAASVVQNPALFFIDVPVAGHKRVLARICSQRASRATVRMSVIDQEKGIEIGSCAENSGLDKPSLALSVDLRGIFANIAIAFALRSPAQSHSECKIEMLRLE